MFTTLTSSAVSDYREKSKRKKYIGEFRDTLTPDELDAANQILDTYLRLGSGWLRGFVQGLNDKKLLGEVAQEMKNRKTPAKRAEKMIHTSHGYYFSDDVFRLDAFRSKDAIKLMIDEGVLKLNDDAITGDPNLIKIASDFWKYLKPRTGPSKKRITLDIEAGP